MMEDIACYVTVYSGGHGDNHYFGIAYVGTKYEQAFASAKKIAFEDGFNNYASIQYWQDGKLIQEEEINI
jgi:hypothetical protein